MNEVAQTLISLDEALFAHLFGLPLNKAGVAKRITPPDKFSFPSGHTAGAFVICILVANCFPIFSIPVFLWAFLVGFSRVHLGVHFPLDVLVGGVIGAFCGYLAILVLA
ncbi:MAG: phosphatase PAP2 family protein [Bdellovibrio sp.]|nr:phosphatase PAP2 family protein [Bdellovibrio sp.]